MTSSSAAAAAQPRPAAGRTAISAHRGGAGLWPENSALAFRAVRALDVDSVEFDVHPSADGRIVVHHDPLLGRVVEGEGALCEQDWASLSTLRFKGHPEERMPLLEELIEILKPSALKLRLEFKAGPDRQPYPGIVEAVHGLLQRHGMLGRTMVSSFASAYLETVHKVDPALHRIWLIRPSLLEEMGIGAVIEEARRLGVPEVDPRADSLQPEWPARFAAAGLRLGAFAANDAAAIGRVFALGVAMFTTDHPDLAVSLRPGA